MIPDAASVAFRGSLSNQRSTKSRALDESSWISRCCRRAPSRRNARPRPAASSRPRTSIAFGSGGIIPSSGLANAAMSRIVAVKSS